jgi:TrpR-related protein YerC/YecD
MSVRPARPTERLGGEPEMRDERSHSWSTEPIQDLLRAVLRLRTLPEAESFFRDLCTLGELEAMAQRWQVAQLVDQGISYQEVSRRTGASTTTVTRVAHWLRHGEGGYRLALDRLRASGRRGSRSPSRPRGGSASPPST